MNASVTPRPMMAGGPVPGRGGAPTGPISPTENAPAWTSRSSRCMSPDPAVRGWVSGALMPGLLSVPETRESLGRGGAVCREALGRGDLRDGLGERARRLCVGHPLVGERLDEAQCGQTSGVAGGAPSGQHVVGSRRALVGERDGGQRAEEQRAVVA